MPPRGRKSYIANNATMQKLPNMNSETKICQNCKSEFVIEPEDFDFYKKMSVPPPTWCPECRLVRRLVWRNERSLHKRICELCKKTTLAVYSEQVPIKVYCNECWWSDKWDALKYGVDFDPSQPFLEQLFDLMHRVPAVSRFGLYASLVNSEYTNMVSYLKNCYLITHSDFNEDCAYGSNVTNSKDCMDTYLIDKCESCYEIINCRECYQAFFSIDCSGCHSVFFSRNCIGCSDCFGCTNLRNKKYHIFNQAYTKEEYKKKVNELYPSTIQKLKAVDAESNKSQRYYPQKFMHERHNSNVSGDYIYNSKNVKDSFIAAKLQDSKFCMLVTPGEGMASDCYDFTHFGVDSELLYESLMGGRYSRVRFCWFNPGGRDMEYSMWCVDGKNLFGCVGIKKNQYCILNKSYSKEGFEILRGKIIAQMNEKPYVDKKGGVYRYGEFFPPEKSPFGYNETAHIYFPLSKEEIVNRGYNWCEPDERAYAITKKGDQIPDSFEFQDSVKDEILGCEHDGKCDHNCSLAFRFVPYELGFYKKNKLPLPRLCPNCRHAKRVEKTNSPRFQKRSCMCLGKTTKNNLYANIASHFHGENSCPNEFETSYAPERPEIVYCESCYQSEVA